MIKRKEILVKVRVVAENRGIVDNLLNFNNRNMSKVNINSCKEVGQVVEVAVNMIVNGGYEEAIKVIRKLNTFLTNKTLNYKYGYSEIITTPSTYEVTVNE
ncbi:hypothetical protein [Clostridium gasigenes]|uniref:Uncharacterized protein n=1 Tax=Clostridium gasigenes TaxID=94869 RepID=A0A1H0V3W5_9CLOT|nr:hypothetical protein [Clostridium gasigenes]SDP73127.1 hypothetical protein SAMN04488529_11432 [Clostridium gasigenes]